MSRTLPPVLVPELLVRDLAASLKFWCGLLGAEVLYDRPEQGFACLDLAGARVMLEQISPEERQWITGDLTPPLGRGINFEITLPEIAPALARLAAVEWPLFMAMEKISYRVGDGQARVRQCLVQDPDGYLLRLAQELDD